MKELHGITGITVSTLFQSSQLVTQVCCIAPPKNTMAGHMPPQQALLLFIIEVFPMAAGLLAELHQPSNRQLRIHVSWLRWQTSTGEQADLTSQRSPWNAWTTLPGRSHVWGRTCAFARRCLDVRNVNVLTRTSKGFHSKDGQNVWEPLPSEPMTIPISGTTGVDRPRHLWARWVTCETCTAPVLTSSDPQIPSEYGVSLHAHARWNWVQHDLLANTSNPLHRETNDRREVGYVSTKHRYIPASLRALWLPNAVGPHGPKRAPGRMQKQGQECPLKSEGCVNC